MKPIEPPLRQIFRGESVVNLQDGLLFLIDKQRLPLPPLKALVAGNLLPTGVQREQLVIQHGPCQNRIHETAKEP